MISPEAVTAFAALLGAALGAALGSFLTYRYTQQRDQLELMRDVLRRAMGYRWQLTQGRGRSTGEVYTALNEILVVFSGDKDVEDAVVNFHIAVNRGFRSKDILPLLKAMAASAGVPHARWNQDVLETPFTPPSGNG